VNVQQTPHVLVPPDIGYESMTKHEIPKRD
jgi:hypothetical protein